MSAAKVIINDLNLSEEDSRAIGVALVHFEDLLKHGSSSTAHNSQQEKEAYLKSIETIRRAASQNLMGVGKKE